MVLPVDECYKKLSARRRNVTWGTFFFAVKFDVAREGGNITATHVNVYLFFTEVYLGFL